MPAVRVAGRELRVLVIDVDASIVICHSQKQAAAARFKGAFGFTPRRVLRQHPPFLAGRLRPGNAGANTAADHIEVLDQALAQVPDQYRHGTPILIRTDAAGCTKAFLAHIRVQHEHDVACEFSVLGHH